MAGDTPLCRDLNNLATFLGLPYDKSKVSCKESVPSLKIDGCKLKGLVTISKYLARKVSKPSLLGESIDDQAVVQQWLEYRVSQLDRCVEERDLTTTLKEMNSYLSERVFIVGQNLSLADIILFYGLQKAFMTLSFYEKEQYIYLSRWFQQVQHIVSSKHSLNPVKFQKTTIYS